MYFTQILIWQKISRSFFFFSTIFFIAKSSYAQVNRGLEIEQLLSTSESLLYADSDSSILLAEIALDQILDKDTIKLIKAYSQLIESASLASFDDTTLFSYEERINHLAKYIEDDLIGYQTFSRLGKIALERRLSVSPYTYFKKANKRAIKLDSAELIAASLSWISRSKLKLEKKEEALKHAMSAMVIAKEINNSELISLISLNLGLCYHNKGLFKKADQNYYHALEVLSHDVSKRLVREIYLSIAQNHIQWHRKKKDDDQLDKVVSISKKVIQLDSMYGGIYIEKRAYFVSTLVLAQYMGKHGFVKEGLALLPYSLLNHANDTLTRRNYSNIEARFFIVRAFLLNIANQYEAAAYALGEIKISKLLFEGVLSYYYQLSAYNSICLKRPVQAIHYAQEGIKRLQGSASPYVVLNLKEFITKAYEMLPASKESFDALSNYHVYRDSLWNEEKSAELSQKNALELLKFISEKQNLHTKTMVQAKKIGEQRIRFIAAVIIAIVFLSVAFSFYHQLKKRRELLNEISRQSVKLKELDQAKSRFFANISHDLRSPLTLILGALDRIRENNEEWLDRESNEWLDVGQKNGKRLLCLADEIMELNRLEEGKMKIKLQPVRIVPYLKMLIEMFKSAVEIKNIKLKLGFYVSEDCTLRLDPKQFEKIIYNLFSNAIKFTPENGVINILLQTSEQDIQIIIADSGPGIAKETIPYIFDRYYQSKSTDSSAHLGVGIGLAIVQELISLHHGKIEVESTTNGSTFCIKMPIAKANISETVVPQNSLDLLTRNELWADVQDDSNDIHLMSFDGLEQSAKRILVVEDHRELRIYIKSVLCSLYKVYSVSDGHQALEVLKNRSIDLVITDLMMPKMNGFELIQQLKKDKELRKTPVLVVSARSHQSVKLDLISKGVGLIHKPFDKEELILTIQNLIELKRDTSVKVKSLSINDAEGYEKNVMAKLENYIMMNISDPNLSVSSLANEIAASGRKLHRLVKKMTNLAPYELIKEVRLQYIKNYLNHNKITSVSKLAQLVGMNNASYFNEQYQKRFGKSLYELVDQEKMVQ